MKALTHSIFLPTFNWLSNVYWRHNWNWIVSWLALTFASLVSSSILIVPKNMVRRWPHRCSCTPREPTSILIFINRLICDYRICLNYMPTVINLMLLWYKLHNQNWPFFFFFNVYKLLWCFFFSSGRSKLPRLRWGYYGSAGSNPAGGERFYTWINIAIMQAVF